MSSPTSQVVKLGNLPFEIIIYIIDIICTSTPRRVVSLISSCSLFRDLILPRLYTHMTFRTLRQLTLFKNCTHLACMPKTLTLTFAGGKGGHSLFSDFHKLVKHIIAIIPDEIKRKKNIKEQQRPVLSLQKLHLCLNSLMSSPNSHYLREVLELVNPEEFVWTGPDPGHHFSTAIVSPSAFQVFESLASWKQLRHLKLTNMAFPSDELAERYKIEPTNFALSLAGSTAHCIMRREMRSNELCKNTTLESVYIGKTTFLNPELIAALACEPMFENLESIQIVDAYQGSIWGPRVRLDDVLKASERMGNSDGFEDRLHGSKERRARIEDIVKCSAEKERIIGGDRMDGSDSRSNG